MADPITKLEKAFRRDPHFPHFARLAELYLKRGRIERALALCQKGCENFPDYATGFIVLSKCYEKQGDLKQAHAAMGQALRLDPENPSGYKHLAHLFEQLGLTPLVLQNLRQAADLDPFDPSLAEQIDRFASQTDQAAPEPKPEEVAVRAESKAPDTQAAQPPKDHDDLYGDSDDSELLRLLQEIEEDKAAAPRPAPSEPPTPAVSEPSTSQSKRIATMTLAEIYTTQGLTQKAIETYRELLEQEPTNTIIRSKLASLERGSNAH